MFNRASFLDTTIDKKVLKKNIKFLAESLLAFLFDYDIKVYINSKYVEFYNLQRWRNFARWAKFEFLYKLSQQNIKIPK